MIRQRASLLHVLLPLAVRSAAAAAAMDAGGTTPRRPAEQLEVARDDTTPRRPAEPLQVARGRCPRRGEKPCLFWMHIQKTGTAFGATMAAVGCPEQPKQRNVRKWSDACSYALGAGSHTHSPYIRARHGVGTAVTLIRSPRARLASAWFFGLREVGHPMLPLGHPEKNRSGWAARRRLRRAMPTIQAYARYPGIAHCQTKMVLGIHCGEAVDVTPDMSREAIRRLQEDFRFVGVQDHWSASVQLALAEFNATSSAELVKSAQARHQYTKRERAAAMANLTAYEDVYDEALYDAAAALLRERCAARGILVEANAHEGFVSKPILPKG